MNRLNRSKPLLAPVFAFASAGAAIAAVAGTPAVAQTEDPTSDLPTPVDNDDVYSARYLDHVLTGAEVGETLRSDVQIDFVSEGSDQAAAFVLQITDAVDIQERIEHPELPAGDHLTGNATIVDDYDNCDRLETGILSCIIPGLDISDGNVYGPSEATPIEFLIEGEVGADDRVLYYLAPLSSEGVENALAAGDFDLAGPNQFALSPLAADRVGPEADFGNPFGQIAFDAEPVTAETTGPADTTAPAGTDTPGAGPKLPETGSSSIVLVSAATALVAVGAVLFFLVRRRRESLGTE